MRRRDFLKTGALTTAALTLGQMPVYSQSKKHSIQKAVKFTMIDEPDLSIGEKFQLLKDLGFDGVELESPNEFETAEVIAARDSVELPIHGIVDSVHWTQPLSDPDSEVRAAGVKGLQTAIQDAHDYGASTVLLVPGVVNKQVSYSDAYSRSQTEIRKVLPMASDLGITIAFENVWNKFLLSPLECARYVDEFEHDHVGWYFDVGNVVTYGYPEHWIHALGHRIVKLDIKEYSRSKGESEGPFAGFEVPLGQGDCDWPAVNEALDSIGFEGWATAEVASGDRIFLKGLADRMDQVLPSDS
ncbi:MAG: TIM barrel protein [Bacteroidetes bacterium]|nr:TIM barrel protein [Bacteroidota bacterium]